MSFKSFEKIRMFVLSKLMSAITQPMFWLAVWWCVTLGLLGFESLPHALLRPLENRYPVPSPEAVSRHEGVIVLGGSCQQPWLLATSAWHMARAVPEWLGLGGYGLTR